MIRGKCRFFDAKRGFGIVDLDGGQDVFAHFSTISGGGYLADGEVVDLEFVVVGRGRLRATRVDRVATGCPADVGRCDFDRLES